MDNIEQIVFNMRKYFNGDRTKSVPFRIDALKKLKRAILENEPLIYRALKQDLGKHEYEAYLTEVGTVLHEIGFAIKHIKKWAKPESVKTPFMHFISKSRIYCEPYGVTLIISPWNYPFLLTFAPLAGAIAAGNCAVVKPSDYSPAASDVTRRIINGIFEPAYVKVLTGGRAVNQSLLEQNFDYIFFTGSPEVGKTVMAAAAKSLTPVTLELGGKSPCIVDETADIELAAKRIVWGKFLNSGQTCVAPDYVYVQKSVKELLLSGLKKHIVRFWGDAPETNPDYPKIVNEKHFLRLSALLDNGKIVIGGMVNAAENRIAPAVLTDVTWDSPVMGGEIFGPVLPVLEFEHIGEAVAAIKARPKPLALYLFTNDPQAQAVIMSRLSFGGGCVNDTVVHLATPYMPFGGVGNSGMGGYHGEYGFMTFSHRKSVLKKSNLIDINLRYPPYDKKIKTIKRFLR